VNSCIIKYYVLLIVILYIRVTVILHMFIICVLDCIA